MARTSKAAQRERQVLELRMAGLPFDEIARRVGYANRGSAKKAYDRALTGTGVSEMSDRDWRALEIHRLERAHAAVWAKAARGDLAAVREAVRLHDRRVRLMGLTVAPHAQHDDHEAGTSGTVVTEDTMDRLRQRRERDAADRIAGSQR